MDISPFIYLFNNWWTVGFPSFGSYEPGCYEYSCLSFVQAWVFHSFAYMPSHMVTKCWTFPGTARLFAKAIVPFYISTNKAWEFQYLHILVNTCFLLFFFDFSHSCGCKMLSLWFWFAFSQWLMTLSIFSCACCPFLYIIYVHFKYKTWQKFMNISWSCDISRKQRRKIF